MPIKVKGGTCVKCRQIFKRGEKAEMRGGFYYHPSCDPEPRPDPEPQADEPPF